MLSILVSRSPAVAAFRASGQSLGVRHVPATIWSGDEKGGKSTLHLQRGARDKWHPAKVHHNSVARLIHESGDYGVYTLMTLDGLPVQRAGAPEQPGGFIEFKGKVPLGTV